ncbi:MAG: ferredoxin III, nif-specific [Methylococcales bacterium]|nr:ferredoxin III, nif-specific [Methylococcales bacterium]
MSEFVTGTTFGGTVWTPQYVTNLNQKTCIACGRCFKVCPRDVFNLIDKEDLEDDFDDDYGDFEDDDDNSMVMSLKNPDDCIGCQACSKVCPKNCFTHQPKAA